VTVAASVADRVYAALRERILAGDIPHHARLHQEQLSEELGVSRTPLREALGRLAADGLVELLPQRGARVADCCWTGWRRTRPRSRGS
jgi:DNA-binding GntR family transcriptional regulator